MGHRFFRDAGARIRDLDEDPPLGSGTGRDDDPASLGEVPWARLTPDGVDADWPEDSAEFLGAVEDYYGRAPEGLLFGPAAAWGAAGEV